MPFYIDCKGITWINILDGFINKVLTLLFFTILMSEPLFFCLLIDNRPEKFKDNAWLIGFAAVLLVGFECH